MMKILFLSLYKFLVLTSAAVTLPLVFLNTSEAVNTVSNRPFIGTPDPRFKIEVLFDGSKLPPISCLMNTVEVLANLGLRDFLGSMEHVAWKLDDYPEVGIVISPRTKNGSIALRFVIWGLSQGAAHMINLIRFQAVTFTLLWEGEEVGTIKLVDWPTMQYTSRGTHINWMQNLTQQSNMSLVQSPSSPSVFHQNTNITTENAQDGHLIVRAMLTGSTVPLFDVFLLVIAVLVDAARLGATEQLRDYASPANAAGVEIAFKGPVLARTSPPFFEVHWLMQTMVMIPEYMIKKGTFKEALVLVEIDGVRVADGFLEQKEAGVGLTNVNSNISVF